MKPVIIMGAMLLALVGCTSSFQSSSPGFPEGYSVDRYYIWLEEAGSEELFREHERIVQKDQSALTITEVVQLALIISVSGLGNEQAEFHAVELLDGLDNREARNRQEQSYLEFSKVWKRILEQGYESYQTNQRQAELEQEIEVLKEHNRRLQEQIDALTTIERQLIERER